MLKSSQSQPTRPSFPFSDLCKDLHSASELETPPLSIDAFLETEGIVIESLKTASIPEQPPPSELLRTIKSQKPLQAPSSILTSQIYVLARQSLEQNRDIAAAQAALDKARKDIENLGVDLREVIRTIEG